MKKICPKNEQTDFFLHKVRLGIYDIDGIARKPSLEIIGGGIHNPGTRFFWSPADVRCEEAILSSKQRIIASDWFGWNNVQPDRINFAAVESRPQLFLV